MPVEMPRGVRDYSPAEAISVKYISGVIEEVYKRFGFYPLQTPSIEMKSVLNAKVYGDEPSKELFAIEGEESGLRYDFTVPLARYVASNRDLPLPFKRYQIGNMWRKEEPQKMRYREGMQADIDIVGTKEIDADAEVIAAAAIALEELGIRNYIIVINSRQLLQKILGYFKVPAEKQTQALRILDKIQKSSGDEILKQFSDAGMNGRSGEELLNFVKMDQTNDEKLDRVGTNVEGAKEEVKKMSELLSILSEYRLNGKIMIDLALARGLNYYTGFVWEFVMEEDGRRMPSIGGGGRFDDLIGVFSNRSIPAAGSSLGISRIFDLIAPKNGPKTYAKAFIAYLGVQNRGYAITVANNLRGNGIYVDLNSTSRNLSKQLEYAGSLRIRNVIILGDREREASKINLRNMDSGEEELISVQDAIGKLKV
jgi:histidyl-tRNA synthetase